MDCFEAAAKNARVTRSSEEAKEQKKARSAMNGKVTNFTFKKDHVMKDMRCPACKHGYVQSVMSKEEFKQALREAREIHAKRDSSTRFKRPRHISNVPGPMLTCIDPRIPTKEPRILRPPRLIRVERLDIPPHVRKVLITHSTKSAFDARK